VGAGELEEVISKKRVGGRVGSGGEKKRPVK